MYCYFFYLLLLSLLHRICKSLSTAIDPAVKWAYSVSGRETQPLLILPLRDGLAGTVGEIIPSIG